MWFSYNKKKIKKLIKTTPGILLIEQNCICCICIWNVAFDSDMLCNIKAKCINSFDWTCGVYGPPGPLLEKVFWGPPAVRHSLSRGNICRHCCKKRAISKSTISWLCVSYINNVAYTATHNSLKSEIYKTIGLFIIANNIQFHFVWNIFSISEIFL